MDLVFLAAFVANSLDTPLYKSTEPHQVGATRGWLDQRTLEALIARSDFFPIKSFGN